MNLKALRIERAHQIPSVMNGEEEPKSTARHLKIFQYSRDEEKLLKRLSDRKTGLTKE